MMSGFDAEWLARVTAGRWTRKPIEPIVGIVNDSRGQIHGMLYVALHGERYDGHRFVGPALSAGAAAAMVDSQSGVADAHASHPLLVVEDTQSALSVLAHAYRNQVGPLTVGVTGSVGKSTVKEMCASVLGVAGETAKTRGNWNNEIGLPLSMLAMNKQALFGVFEVGMNHPGEVGDLCRVLQPDWGVVTIVGPVHLEHFASVDAIATEKGALLKSLPEDGRAFLCRDDKWFSLLSKMASCPVRTVSFEQDADLKLEHDAAGNHLIVSEKGSGETHAFVWSQPGRHNALNAGFAILVGREAGMTWQQIAQGLADYQPLPMRWQEHHARGCLLINDAYNANPASMQAALRTFVETPCSGRRWLVLGDMLELGETARWEHEQLGQKVACESWAGLLTVGPQAVGIADGATRNGMASSRIWCCEDTHMAATVLRKELKSGDAVLFKASRGIALERVIDELSGNNKEGVCKQ
jgi:UDP-N-acetylmuramoyl-tripeptide--D-alanyl-D-alanine ligase